MKVLTVGAPHFARALRLQGAEVLEVDWHPPAGGNARLADALARLWAREDVEQANHRALERMLAASPVLVDLGRALEVVPGMTRDTLLHAGPPITWEYMCGPMRGAVIGALLYEHRAPDEREAVALAEGGHIRFEPCHDHHAVGAMAGIISPSMPVFVVEERASGGIAFCPLNEGLGRVLRYGAYDAEVIQRLRWMERVLAPALVRAVRASGGLDLRALLSEAVQMGDEGHNRNRAAGGLFLKAIAPHLARADLPPSDLTAVLRFIADNQHFTLPLSMAACKAAADAADGIPGATLVTAMARNGVEFGVRVSGLPGRWFTAPAPVPRGLLFPGFVAEDANPDLGDSAITETCGLGGFAMAAAPAIVQFVGGSVDDTLRYTREMDEITLGESQAYRVPSLGFRGTPTGIDARLVVQAGIQPLITTGIAHRQPGVGQVGAGLVRAPWEPFARAVAAVAQELETRPSASWSEPL